MQAVLRGCAVLMVLILLVLTGVATHAEDSAPQPAGKAPPPEALLKALTVDEFKEALPPAKELNMQEFIALKEKGGVVVLDVRSKESFERRHLKGSINAPLTDLTEKNLPSLLPDKEAQVVLACDYSFMPVRMVAMTIQAYPVLHTNGYKNVHRLNLWRNKPGGQMIDAAEQEKLLEFEGSTVTPKQ